MVTVEDDSRLERSRELIDFAKTIKDQVTVDMGGIRSSKTGEITTLIGSIETGLNDLERVLGLAESEGDLPVILGFRIRPSSLRFPFSHIIRPNGLPRLRPFNGEVIPRTDSMGVNNKIWGFIKPGTEAHDVYMLAIYLSIIESQNGPETIAGKLIRRALGISSTSVYESGK